MSSAIADQHDTPLFQTEHTITLPEYEEAMDVHQRAWSRAMRWPAIMIWLLAFALVTVPRIWIRPDAPIQGSPLARLSIALLNLLVLSLPLLMWLMLFVFIWVNVFLGMRQRRPERVPVFQFLQPRRSEHLRSHAVVWMPAIVMAMLSLVNLTIESRNERANGTPMQSTELVVAAVIALLPALLVVVIAAVLMFYNIFWRVKGAYQRQPHLQLQHTYEFFDAHVESSNRETSSDTTWNGYRKAIESPNLFILYKSDVAIEMIPKRAFGSDAELDRFRQYLKERLPSGPAAFPVTTVIR